MDYDAADGVSLPTPLDQDAMWPMNLRANEGMDQGPYPERPGEQDCAYYIRTGLCKFGMTCRFNHPPNRKLAIAAAKMKGVYPERPGQPECQYYLKTGTCKFGPTCKFHHPRDKAGLSGRVLLNMLGYPLRPNERECAYYIRTGQCKFGSTCKFHHPQPSSPVASLRSSPVYPAVHSSTSPGQQTNYQSGVANWALSRASFIPSPRWQGPSNYAQLILPQGVVPVQSWNPAIAQGQLGSVSPPEGQQQPLAGGQFYSSPRQTETSSAGGTQGAVSSYGSGSLAMGLYAIQRDNIFPLRPDQPECQFYMKTGDCKFGAVCKFHHPRERLIPTPNCMLSPMGLPLRPGEPLCIFYSRYGVCKFGPNCKFDHPVGTFAYGFSSSAQSDVPVVRRLLGPATVNSSFSLPSGGSVESGSGSSRRLSASESRQRSLSNENIETDGPRTNTNIGPVSTFS